MGRFVGRTESGGERRGGVVVVVVVIVFLKMPGRDGALERRGRGWRHCEREGRGRGKAGELVEGGLLMGGKGMTFWWSLL